MCWRRGQHVPHARAVPKSAPTFGCRAGRAEGLPDRKFARKRSRRKRAHSVTTPKHVQLMWARAVLRGGLGYETAARGTVRELSIQLFDS